LTFLVDGGTMQRVKVTIVGGAGGVGASTAFNLALLQDAHEVVRRRASRAEP
jgi:glycine/D-amino acid oxidase-like deaminating enzyme